MNIKRKILNNLPDSIYLKLKWFLVFHKRLDLKNPRTFNEKIQWLKLYDRNPEYTNLVDKYLVRNYISQIIGDEYLIPLIGVWNNVSEIDFETLPNKFVLKSNHDSGSIRICRDKSKFDFVEAEVFFEKKLKSNFYYTGREWPYKNVKPKIIAEKLLEIESMDDVPDYKFMCFDGNVEYCFTCTDRFSEDGLKVTFFDKNWNKQMFERHYPMSKNEITPPKNLSKMILLAEKLSKGIPFVRVDFYEINDKIYFGELTFYPGGGYEKFDPEYYDELIGSKICLKNKR